MNSPIPKRGHVSWRWGPPHQHDPTKGSSSIWMCYRQEENFPLQHDRFLLSPFKMEESRKRDNFFSSFLVRLKVASTRWKVEILAETHGWTQEEKCRKSHHVFFSLYYVYVWFGFDPNSRTELMTRFSLSRLSHPKQVVDQRKFLGEKRKKERKKERKIVNIQSNNTRVSSSDNSI